ncbi:MAG: c-type cytochrome [Myxococcota bacterium]
MAERALPSLAPVMLLLGCTPPIAGVGERGQHIFLRGESLSGGEVVAAVSANGVAVPASVLPCVGCHGRNGKGRPEGGVAPADITWSALTRPYAITTPSGRKRPAYTEELLRRAITEGVDPAGNVLLDAMPRYRMSSEDLADLVAFITQPPATPGVTSARVVVGLVGGGGDTEDVLRAYFAEVNAGGGIYRRHLELVVLHTAKGAVTESAQLEHGFRSQPPFALLVDTACAGSMDWPADLVVVRFADVHGASPGALNHPAAAAARALVQGLRRAGRDLTSESLAHALTSLGRRVNASGD